MEYYIISHNYTSGKCHRGQKSSIELSVPDALVFETLSQMHDTQLAYHSGIQITIQLIRERYYWKTSNADVNNYARSCE